MFNWLKNQTARAGFVVALVAVSLAYAATGTIWTLTGKGSRRNTVEFSIESPTVGTAAKFCRARTTPTPWEAPRFASRTCRRSLRPSAARRR
jgi:hypothetical protein